MTIGCRKGINNPIEGELKSFLKEPLSSKILKWWLADPSPKTRTPNWDFISTCKINEEYGFLLVEAKGHDREFNTAGQKLFKNASLISKQNHDRIGKSISEARVSLNTQFPSLAISRDKCYQLSNRITHAWWLASHGVPTILLYLGFLNTEYQSMNSYRTFTNAHEWYNELESYLKTVGAELLLSKKIDCEKSYFTFITAVVNS